MGFMKRHLLDLMFLCTVVLLASTLAWEWSNVQSFISGGVVAVWLTLRVTRSRRHESRQA